MKHFLTFGAALLLTGCATSAKYEAALDTWVGSTELELVKAWGPPMHSYETSGSKFLAYSSQRSAYMPGTSPSFTTSYVGGNAYTTTAGGTRGFNIPLSCKTTFELIEGKVSSWSYEGNACTSR